MSAGGGASVLARMARRIAQLERRLENTVRHGVVREVDTERQRMRLAVGVDAGGAEQLSPWIPYGQHAGDYKHHAPPTEGMSFTMFAPGGDWRQAVAIPLTWSDANPSPSKKGDEHVETFGDLSITRRKDEMILAVGATKVHFRPGGTDALTVEVGSTRIHLTQDGISADAETFVHRGERVEHDGRNIGKQHRHSDVMVGTEKTGEPGSE